MEGIGDVTSASNQVPEGASELLDTLEDARGDARSWYALRHAIPRPPSEAALRVHRRRLNRSRAKQPSRGGLRRID